MSDPGFRQTLRISVEGSGIVLASRAVVARTILSRMVGLLQHNSLEAGEGLVLTSCRSIHTMGMRFAIDAVFVGRDWRVVAIRASLRPGRMTPVVWGSSQVIELPAGTAEKAGLKVGDRLLAEPKEAKNVKLNNA